MVESDVNYKKTVMCQQKLYQRLIESLLNMNLMVIDFKYFCSMNTQKKLYNT